MYTDIPFHFTYFIIVSSGREDNLTDSWIVIPGILRELIGRLLHRNILTNELLKIEFCSSG